MSPGEFLGRDQSKIKPAPGICAIFQQVSMQQDTAAKQRWIHKYKPGVNPEKMLTVSYLYSSQFSSLTTLRPGFFNFGLPFTCFSLNELHIVKDGPEFLSLSTWAIYQVTASNLIEFPTGTTYFWSSP